MSGPLGTLPGMSYDPARNRYFPTPRTSSVQTEDDHRPLPSASLRSSGLNRSSFNNAEASGSGSHLSSGNASSSTSSPGPSPSIRSGNRSYNWAQNRSLRNQPNQSQTETQWQQRNVTSGSSSDASASEPNPRLGSRRNRRAGEPSMRKVESVIIPPTDCFTACAEINNLNGGIGENESRTKRPRSSNQARRSGIGVTDRSGRVTKGRLGVRYDGCLGHAKCGSDRLQGEQVKILSNLEVESEHHSCGCHGETITSYRSYGNEAYSATTDHGKVIVHLRNGNTAVFTICEHSLAGLHIDIPRSIFISISAGTDPHLHLYKRDPELLDHVLMTHCKLDLYKSEIYGVSSFDDVCTIGGAGSITTITYTSRLGSTNRKLPSDALAVHQSNRDLVYAGLRSGVVALEDLRTPSCPSSWKLNVVASTLKGKAVVGVKRLADSAVPWGLVVSGMSHEMLLFDVRFGSQPLRTFDGHFNTYHTGVSLVTSPDDKVLFASGSDRRIRAWNVLTGEPLVPTDPESSSSPHSRPHGHGSSLSQSSIYAGSPLTEMFGLEHRTKKEQEEQANSNPLTRVFEHRVTHMSVREDLGLDVVEHGDLIRFSRR